jgi:SHS2 domain-containing protein
VQGHRLLPHTADLIIEAWGPTRETCLQHAVAGLVEACGEIEPGAATDEIPLAFSPQADEELLLSMLEEVVYLADVRGVLPRRLDIRRTANGGLSGVAHVVGMADISPTGPAPKAVTRHGLELRETDGVWRARATNDV